MSGIERANSSSNALLKDWTKVERAKAIGATFAIIILTSCIVLGSTGSFGVIASHPEAFLGSLAGLTMLGLIFIVLGKSQKSILDPKSQHQQQTQSVSEAIAQPVSSTVIQGSENSAKNTVVSAATNLPLVAIPSPMPLPLSSSVTDIVNGSSSVSPVVPVPVEIPTVAVAMRCKGTLLKFKNNDEIFNIAELNPKMTVAELTQRVLTDVCFQSKEVENSATYSRNFGTAYWVSRFREKVKDIVIQDSEGNDLDGDLKLETIPNLTSLYVRFRTWVYCKQDLFKNDHFSYYTSFRHVTVGTKSWYLCQEGNSATNMFSNSKTYFFEALTDPSFTSEEVANDMNHHIKNVIAKQEYRIQGGVLKSDLKFS